MESTAIRPTREFCGKFVKFFCMTGPSTALSLSPRWLLRILLISAAVTGFPGSAAGTDPPPAQEKPDTTIIRALPLDPDDPARAAVGALAWRGGIEVVHQDRRFGGLSGLHVSRDGRRMTAITDRGAWVTARLSYRQGLLTGMTRIRIGDLKGRISDRLPGSWRDAESLSPDGAGGFLVSFERRHRIWRYPARPRGAPFDGRPLPIPGPADIGAQPNNGGIEAMTRLCDGRLLAISEKSRAGPVSYRGWLRTARAWTALAYAGKASYRPTAAATLPDCDVVIVERSFNILTGVRARLVRVAAGSIKPGATLTGDELAVLAPPLSVDNMEGVAARRGENGETLLYLVSDDNFSGLQRTLLLLFALPSAGSAPAGG